MPDDRPEARTDDRQSTPRTDAVLADPRLAGHLRDLGRSLVKETVRAVLADCREGRVAPDDVVAVVLDRLPRHAMSLRPVLNATGVVVHTNLGRAPLSAAAVEALRVAAGTTDVGAIDPLPEIGAVAREHRLWYHIDAAYGGFFILTDEGRDKLRGLETSDSLIIDPHKGLFLPYGLGVVLVKNVEDLKRSYSFRANYMQDAFAGRMTFDAARATSFRSDESSEPTMIAGSSPAPAPELRARYRKCFPSGRKYG